tara:strand:+ start:1251 stop:1547 length:297 start_codon:yes stop_codon:yes gene_type:complete
MNTNLKNEIRFLGELIITAQKIKGDNMSNPIHTTAGMNGQEDIDEKLGSLIDYMKTLHKRLIGMQGDYSAHAFQLNCMLKEALKYNHKLESLENDPTK